jgi:hypothetical protein
MRGAGCAWLTVIDRHALHGSCTSRLGSLAKPYLRWSLQGPGAFTLDLLVKVFMLSQVRCKLYSILSHEWVTHPPGHVRPGLVFKGIFEPSQSQVQ